MNVSRVEFIMFFFGGVPQFYFQEIIKFQMMRQTEWSL